MKKLIFLFSLVCFFCLQNNVFSQFQTAAVVSVYTQGAKISPEMAESILRIELTKTDKFNVFDKLDMLEILNAKQIDVSNCFGRNCLLSVGKSAEVDKMYSKSYVRHLIRTDELLAMYITSLHNLAFYIDLVKEARKHIKAGDFVEWKNKMVKQVSQRI